MTTIILHGHLKELYPNPIRVEANSAAEAIQSLSLIPELTRVPGFRHHVRVENFDSVDALYDKREVDVLNIYPIVTGSGGGGLGQIIIGIVMIAVAIYAPYLLPEVLQTASGLAAVTMTGAMMVLGGVLQMLAPQPQLNVTNEERSRYLGQGRNTAGIGTRIPMIYGRRKAYGQYISFDIDAAQFDSAPAAWYSSPFTNYGELTNSAAPLLNNDDWEDPATQYNQPGSVFRNITYPSIENDINTVFINFDPVQLYSGVYDINFATGQTLHVKILTSGVVSLATVLGGKTTNLPPNGTPFVFTQNHG